MKQIILSILSWVCLFGAAQATVFAEFTTNQRDALNRFRVFRVALDTVNAPLAVTHFSLLAGKEDDVWRAGVGARLPVIPQPGQAVVPMVLAYQSTTELRENVLVFPVAVPGDAFQVKEYVVVTAGQRLELGRLSPFPSGNTYQDITGRGRIQLEQEINAPFLWRLTIKYPRPWLEPIFNEPTTETFYQNLTVTSLLGDRMFAGTRSIGGKEVKDPGYFLPDELVRVPNVNSADPEVAFRKPFNVPFVLAMNNTGPNRNGSEFFITKIAEPSGADWNGRYTAFGNVFVADRAFVSDLITLSTGAPGAVSILSIKVKRAHPFSVGFFEGYYQNLLPGSVSENIQLSVENVNGKPELLAFSPQNTGLGSVPVITRILSSSDLQTFEFAASAGVARGLSSPVKQFVDANIFGSKQAFFKAMAWEYPVWPSEEVNLGNAIYDFTVDGPGVSKGKLTLVFNPEGTGGTFVNTVQAERYEVRTNPDYVPGNGQFPFITITTLEPEVQTTRNGEFTATYIPSLGPYAATFQIEAITGELEIDHLEIRYSFNPQDHLSALPGAISGLPSPNYFRAYKDEADRFSEEGGRIIPLEYRGSYFKAQ